MQLTPLSEVKYHPINETLKNILRDKTGNTRSDTYFRVLSAFFISQAASNMRCMVETPHRGTLPCNMYALLLGTSGMGKGHSINILEDEIFNGFTELFLKQTMPTVAELALERIAQRKSLTNGTDFDEELELIKAEYYGCGKFPYTFDSGTGPAYRQARTAAQIAEIGALTMVADEIGSNLLENGELFKVNLEAYDVGKIKMKLVKNTSENKRSETRNDPVPSNMLCFGTPSKLFNGGKEETEMWSLMDTGYGRRFMYAVGEKAPQENQSGEDMLKALTATDVSQQVEQMQELFTNLADQANYQRTVKMPWNVAVINAEYQLRCERLAAEMSEHEEIRKAEISHRYFRAIKLATAYAWVDSAAEVTEAHMYSAIKLVEASGECFDGIITRPKPYARLAQYIAAVPEEVTHADIAEALPFYPSGKAKQEEMLAMAIAWGHKNHHIVKRTMMDGIDFFKGESLKEVDLDRMRVAHSDHQAYHYQNCEYSWEQLKSLCQTQGRHFVNHHLLDGHRHDDNVIVGADFFILDCDGEVTIKDFATFMKGIKCYVYTTKRHTPQNNRFRALVPLKYHMRLSKEDYKEFMQNILKSLPFDSDDGSAQRSKKWLANHGSAGNIEGELFDPLPFLPHTKKNQDRIEEEKALKDLDKVQRFFAKQWSSGRNNTCLKYGMMLLDGGMSLEDALMNVKQFNKTFSDPLTEAELIDSVFKSMGKKASGQP